MKENDDDNYLIVNTKIQEVNDGQDKVRSAQDEMKNKKI
jgi:predicted DNA-binding protein